jgi:hypothetical protein
LVHTEKEVQRMKVGHGEKKGERERCDIEGGSQTYTHTQTHTQIDNERDREREREREREIDREGQGEK